MNGAVTRPLKELPQQASHASPWDYFALLKPRVMSLVIFTALVGMVAAVSTGAGIHPLLAAISLLAIAVGAGASGALNMWWDADIDALMARTIGRPIPRGLVPAPEAAGFGGILSALSVALLALAAGNGEHGGAGRERDAVGAHDPPARGASGHIVLVWGNK